jgi:beta-lactamase regulating signal transducer with metallopeptidase domain
VIEHLIVSTVVLAVAMAAARVLPLTARTRYVVLLCGITKFAVPTAVFRFVPAEVIPAALRTFGGDGPATIGAQPAPRFEWLPVAWGAVALLLIVRWLLLRTRTVSAALRSPAPASAREVAAVHEARAAMRVGVAVDAIRSPICEAPAVLRVIRPVIVLPAQGCDDLTDDELRSLVLHECAHVARHDNLASMLQALATSLLWFHPLVWSASHALTIAREEACDEAVADAMHGSDAYVSALSKVCRTLIAPRTAGASCMASAKIKERMEHLMSYETIKGKAWSHRAILAMGVLVIALSTFAATPPSESQDQKSYDGQPISMKLKDADLRDVLKTFGELTGLNFDVASDVQGSVTIEVVDVPWDKVLDDMLNEHGLVGTIDGNTIYVRNKE